MSDNLAYQEIKDLSKFKNRIKKFDEERNYTQVIEENSYESLMKMTLDKYIIPSFNEEEKYIKKWRRKLTVIVLVLLIVEMVIILGTYIISFFSSKLTIEPTIFSVIISGFFVQTIGLFTIIFNFLFNRSDNKILDIIEKFISKRSEYDMNKKK